MKKKMSDNIILQELYKNELELVHKLEATRNAIIGFGGNSNSQILNEDNHKEQIITDSSSINEYSKKWKWENKIFHALKVLTHADVDQITNYIIEIEPELNRGTVKNSVSVRTTIMKKEELLNFKLSTKNKRRHKHIYSLK